MKKKMAVLKNQRVSQKKMMPMQMKHKYGTKANGFFRNLDFKN